MSEPKIAIQISDNVFVKMMVFETVGDENQGHSHTFNHITLLSKGSVEMTHDNGIDTYVAPHLIVTPKGIAHKFKALEADTILCCIHAIRAGEGLEDIAPQEITPYEAGQLMKLYPLLGTPSS
jgi:quercetin dioxygenase-like cupin family protein